MLINIPVTSPQQGRLGKSVYSTGILIETYNIMTIERGIREYLSKSFKDYFFVTNPMIFCLISELWWREIISFANSMVAKEIKPISRVKHP